MPTLRREDLLSRISKKIIVYFLKDTQFGKKSKETAT